MIQRMSERQSCIVIHLTMYHDGRRAGECEKVRGVWKLGSLS